MRPHNGPYKQEAYSDGNVHLSVSIPAGIHAQIVKRLESVNQNRTDWIREAIMEKLERDLKE